MVKPAPIQSLVQAARSGDRAAFESLVTAHGGRIRSLVSSKWRARVALGVTEEDVYQETLLRAFEAIRQLEWRGESSFFGWLGGIAENVIGSLARRRALERREPLPETLRAEGLTPSRALRREERFDRLEQAMRTLGAEHREVVRLVRIEGLSFAAAGERLGRSPDAAKQLLYRALRELRAAFGDTDSLGLPERRLSQEGEGHGSQE